MEPGIPTPKKGPGIRDTHSPEITWDQGSLRGQSKTCQNITFPQLRWRLVIIIMLSIRSIDIVHKWLCTFCLPAPDGKAVNKRYIT